MAYWLIAGGFLQAEHMSTISALVLAVLAALLSCAPLLGVWLVLKLRIEIQELRIQLKSNGGKLDAINKHTGIRATDESDVVSGEVRALRESGLDSPRDGEVQHEERRRDASPDLLRPTTLHARDADDYDQHGGPI